MSHQVPDDKRENLLDVAIRKYPKDMISKIFNLRLFLVSKVVDQTSKETIKDFLGKYLGQSEVDPIVGLSFLYPGATIHLLQSSSEKMFEFLHILVRDQKLLGMWPFRVLLSTDNVPMETIRFFDMTTIDSMKQDFFTANAAVEISIAEVYNALLALAENLSAMTDLRRTDAMQNLLREFFKYLPADFRVLNFADNNELTSLEEYLELFDTPSEWTPMFESGWPIQEQHELVTIERISEIDTEQQQNPNQK
ncbi:hypothetical protein TRFO_37469 [Tritrichomonas foetus]|uniref:Uncharacterized protein n=1 Tax=Tritrichomonas foetus TaxID=1144522 RepID=A0A1J4JB46_9EUKA|nr:hypothetical protein TRFO_37469 [Tritrichomonas foetus]|eukprot:OHS96398.1 hypothetical protein TRFO_37469 [Tritrichomonas foetus]